MHEGTDAALCRALETGRVGGTVQAVVGMGRGPAYERSSTEGRDAVGRANSRS